MKKVLILVDDRGFFYSSTKEVGGSLDSQKLKVELESFGYEVEIRKFYEINFCHSHKDIVVLYQSTEDPDLKYKDYIEDILLGLKKAGATLIPDFEKFRAHHNKVFMEILRELYGLNRETNVRSQKYGTLEEFIQNKQNHTFPSVLKAGIGSRGDGIFRLNNLKDSIRKIKGVSRTFTFMNIKRALRALIDGKGYKKISNHRNKFIIQNFISDLEGDYKVVIYGDRYYIVERKNRKNDFRASGSGKLSFPDNPPKEILDFSEQIFNRFNVPFASFDVAIREDKLYLVEFQFVSFGQYALEKSSFYFKKVENLWRKIDGKSDLEKTFAWAVNRYLKTCKV